MSANVFRFPSIGSAAAISVKPSLPPPPLPSVDVFDVEKARTFHSILENAVRKGKVLADLVHGDRELAAAAGLEGIAIEISALLDTERLIRMRGALGEAVRLGEGATITHEGLGRLHRLEALVAEGSQVLERYQRPGKALSGRRLSLQAPSGSPGSSDMALFGAIVVLGAVAITLAAFLVTKREARRPFFGGVPSGVPPRISEKTKVFP
jgi:hypothetical protein